MNRADVIGANRSQALYGILLFHFISGDENLKSQHDKCSPAL